MTPNLFARNWVQKCLARRYPDSADPHHLPRAFQSSRTVTYGGSPLTVARPSRISTGFPRTRTGRCSQMWRTFLVTAARAAKGGVMVTIVLGPVRSGKSARAAELARASGKRVVFAATAAVDPHDAEMCARVERHRRDRPREWTVVETAHGPALPAVVREARAGDCVLIDALGTWLAALLLAYGEGDGAADALDRDGVDLIAAIAASPADVVVVAEEAGWGVVPATPLGRLFRDALGRLVRRLTGDADRVELVVAGYAVDLRRVGTRVDAADGA